MTAQDSTTKGFFQLDGPLDVPPSDGQVRAANFSRLAELARLHGRDARAIVERHGMDTTVLADPESLISVNQLADTLEYCGTLFHDPLFGMHIAALQDPEVYGCVSAVCRAAPTVREGIRCLIDYLPVVHTPDSEILLLEGNETAELTWLINADVGFNDQASYQAVMLNAKLLKAIAGPGFSPILVNLSTDTSAVNLPEIEQFLDCKVNVRAERNSIAFPAWFLDRPVLTANRVLYRLVSGYLDELRAARSQSVTQQVSSYIRGSLASGTCTIERCAEKLGISVRTLQSRLEEQSQSFSQLVREQRINLAESYLVREQLSLDEIAERLGYGEQTSFGRAFKRWLGMTPQQYRRRQRQ